MSNECDSITITYLTDGDALVKAPNGVELYLSRETIVDLYKGPEKVKYSNVE